MFGAQKCSVLTGVKDAKGDSLLLKAMLLLVTDPNIFCNRNGVQPEMLSHLKTGRFNQ